MEKQLINEYKTTLDTLITIVNNHIISTNNDDILVNLVNASDFYKIKYYNLRKLTYIIRFTLNTHALEESYTQIVQTIINSCEFIKELFILDTHYLKKNGQIQNNGDLKKNFTTEFNARVLLLQLLLSLLSYPNIDKDTKNSIDGGLKKLLKILNNNNLQLLPYLYLMCSIGVYTNTDYQYTLVDNKIISIPVITTEMETHKSIFTDENRVVYNMDGIYAYLVELSNNKITELNITKLYKLCEYLLIITSNIPNIYAYVVDYINDVNDVLFQLTTPDNNLIFYKSDIGDLSNIILNIKLYYNMFSYDEHKKQQKQCHQDMMTEKETTDQIKKEIYKKDGIIPDKSTESKNTLKLIIKYKVENMRQNINKFTLFVFKFAETMVLSESDNTTLNNYINIDSKYFSQKTNTHEDVNNIIDQLTYLRDKINGFIKLCNKYKPRDFDRIFLTYDSINTKLKESFEQSNHHFILIFKKLLISTLSDVKLLILPNTLYATNDAEKDIIEKNTNITTNINILINYFFNSTNVSFDKSIETVTIKEKSLSIDKLDNDAINTYLNCTTPYNKHNKNDYLFYNCIDSKCILINDPTDEQIKLAKYCSIPLHSKGGYYDEYMNIKKQYIDIKNKLMELL
jgi:hypothetical protein